MLYHCISTYPCYRVQCFTYIHILEELINPVSNLGFHFWCRTNRRWRFWWSHWRHTRTCVNGPMRCHTCCQNFVQSCLKLRNVRGRIPNRRIVSRRLIERCFVQDVLVIRGQFAEVVHDGLHGDRVVCVQRGGFSAGNLNIHTEDTHKNPYVWNSLQCIYVEAYI